MTITRLLFTFLSLCLSVSASVVKAESLKVEFTPQSLTDTIENRSAAIRLSNLAVDEASAKVGVAKNNLLPEVSGSLQLGYLGDGYLTDRDFTDGMSITNPHLVNNFAIEAMQTIFSGGAVSSGIRLAELELRMSELSLEENRQQVRFILLSNLIDLNCLYKQSEVVESNIELAEKLLVAMRSRRDEGVVLKSDITRYELQIADLNLQLDRLNERINNLNHRISTALDYPEGTTFALSVESIDETYPLPNAEYWQMLAQSKNTALGKARVGIDMSETALNLALSDRLPHVGAYFFGRMDSPIVTEVPVLNKNFMYWGIGLNVRYNISSLFKSSKNISKARIALSESRTKLELAEQGISDNINEAYNEWLSCCSELRTRRNTLRLAEDNYSIVSERFNEGMALVTDLVDAANVRISAETGVENAQSRLQYCLYKLHYLTNSL